MRLDPLLQVPPQVQRIATLAAEVLAATLLYLLAASAMTWPAVMHMDEVIIGGGELGGWLWRYGWHFTEAQAVLDDTRWAWARRR